MKQDKKLNRVNCKHIYNIRTKASMAAKQGLKKMGEKKQSWRGKFKFINVKTVETI